MANDAKSELAWGELAQASQQGDKDAYRELLTHLRGLLTAYCTRSLSTLGEVDDCVQDCLLAVHKGLNTYDPSRPFLPWLYAIAHNRVVDRLRKFKRRKELEVELVSFAKMRAEGAGGLNFDSEKQLEQILASLSPMYREALVLTKLRGLSISDAAKEANVRESAMKVRVHRAQKMFITCLKEGTKVRAVEDSQ